MRRWRSKSRDREKLTQVVVQFLLVFVSAGDRESTAFCSSSFPPPSFLPKYNIPLCEEPNLASENTSPGRVARSGPCKKEKIRERDPDVGAKDYGLEQSFAKKGRSLKREKWNGPIFFLLLDVMPILPPAQRQWKKKKKRARADRARQGENTQCAPWALQKKKTQLSPPDI